MSRLTKTAGLAVAAVIAGAIAGAWQARAVSAQNKFGQPKSVIHMVVYKWKDGVSDADKQKSLAGIREMAAKIPGIKNLWLKPMRAQPRDFSGAFAIEFQSPEAAADYAEHPAHEAWSKAWLELRQQSLSLQVTKGE